MRVHADFFDGELPIAPSAINPMPRSFTPDSFKETVIPRAMTTDEIAETVNEYAVAARNALAAGFDGVELHAATIYLLPEFLNSALNVREDEYGGNAENRVRIVLEILQSLVDAHKANAVIDAGEADLVSFGTPFIGNPDFVRRLSDGLPLAGSNGDTYYQGGAAGYIEYPMAV